MQINLGGRSWQATAYHGSRDFDIYRHDAVAALRRRPVYRWRCPSGPGTPLGPVTETGAVALPNIVHFHEQARGDILGGRDKRESGRMQRAVLRETDFANLGRLEAAVTAALPIGAKRLPLDAFAWMNPVAHYRLLLETDYMIFSVTSTVAPPDRPAEELRFYLLLPHRLTFTADVEDYCDPSAYEELEAAPGRDLDHEERFIIPTGNALNRNLRVAMLGRRTQVLTARLDSTLSPLSEAGRRRVLAERDEIRRDRARLEAVSFDD